MAKITKISEDLVTPEDVIDDLVEQQATGEIAELYVVAFDSAGRRTFWASGDLSGMAKAAVTMLDKASQNLRDHSS